MPNTPFETPEVPFTNSEQVSMQGQVLYKLASLESAMSSGFQRLDEKMTRFQTDLHDQQLATNDRINLLDKDFSAAMLIKRQRIDALEKRLVELETWKAVSLAKIGGMFAAITLVWIVLGPSIRHILGIAGYPTS